MQLPEPWNADTTDTERDERKRQSSPASFFFSQGQAIKKVIVIAGRLVNVVVG